VDLPEDPNLREITSAKPAFVNTPKDGNSPRSEPGARSLPSDGGECLNRLPDLASHQPRRQSCPWD